MTVRQGGICNRQRSRRDPTNCRAGLYCDQARGVCEPGCGDFLSSHDLEDVLTIVDGHPSVVDELRTALHELRQFVRKTVGALISEPRFEDYLPGLLADSGRTNIVLDRLKSLTS